MKIRKIVVKKPNKKDELEAEIGEYQPEFSINVKHLPEVKNWKVGGKYRLVMDVELASMNLRKEPKDSSAWFKIEAIGGGKKPKERVKRYNKKEK